MQEHENILNVQAWFAKAKRDLSAARRLARNEGNEDLSDTAIYHTQQCAEKSLKAFLVLNKVQILKTHDLEKLLCLCSEIDPIFKDLTFEAAVLTPYGTKFRYPDDELLPDKEDLMQAIDFAEKIFNFVKIKIEERVDPNLRLF